MKLKSIISWRGLSLISICLTITLPRTVTAQTNYYWQTIAQNVATSGGPQGLGVDTSGDIFAANTYDGVIVKANLSGTNWIITTIAGRLGVTGTNDGIGTLAEFNQPTSVAVQNSSTLYIADSQNNTIREIHFDGVNWITTTIAGTGGASGSNDGTNGNAQFASPAGVAVDLHGDLFVADEGNDTIREITHSGTNWVTTTIAGLAGSPGSNDGTNENIQFASPAGVAVDASENVFVADYNNNTIREITPIGTNWVSTTIGGDGTENFTDGTNTSSEYDGPYDVAVDGLDNVYVADAFNNAIRKVLPSGTNWITVSLGGSPSYSGLVDGTNDVAQFNFPQGVAVDLSGDVYVGDTGNNALRLGYLYPPSLQLALTGNLATFTYPFVLGTNFDFTLQSTTNLQSPVWLALTNQWQFTTNLIPYLNLVVTNKIPTRFFRLELP